MDELRASLPELERYASQYTLAVTARRAVRSGEVTGRRTGGSTEFEDRKDFAAGDDLRRVDWRSYARTGRMSVKLFRDDIMPRLDLVVDWTASMSATPAKMLRTLQMTHLLWSIARGMGAQVRLWEAGARATALESPLQMAGRPTSEAVSPLGALRGSPVAAAGGMKVFVTDLLFPFSPTDLRWLFQQSGWPVVVQVLSDFEASPGAGAREAGAFVRLRDAEGPGYSDVRLDEGTVAVYMRRLGALKDDVEGRLRLAGGAMATVEESTMLGDCVSRLLRAGVII